MKREILILASFLLNGLCYAQPFLVYRGVYNTASFMPPGIPGGAIARGSTFAIFGRNFSPAATPPLSFPLPNTLGGVSITVTQGTTVLNAIPVGLSAGQINAIMPSNTPLGMVSVQVTFNNAKSNPLPVRVVNSAFGIFAANSAGIGPGILQNFVSAGEQPINSLQTPARAGQAITLWGTGLGPASFADNVAPSPVSLPIQTEVFVGGVTAPLLYNGRSPCCAGIDQIVFQVPANAPLGCWVPVYVRSGGAAVSNFVTMAISADGAACTEPANAIATPLINGSKTALYLAAKLAVHHDIGVRTVRDATTELFSGYQAEEKQGPFNFNPMFSLPPAGACTLYTPTGDISRDDASIIAGMTPPKGRGLDAGAVTLTGSKGTRTSVASLYPGITGVQLAGAIPSLPLTNTTFLDPGTFQLNGAGGKDVGNFTASMDVPAPLSWTNRDQITNINRAAALTVNWTGAAANNSVFVVGANADLPSNSTAVFLCMAAPGATSLTVPPAVLANIPPTRTRVIQSKGSLYVGQWNLTSPAKFSATGIDVGYLLNALVSGKTVTFQ